jgi:hypothetical protein
MTNTPPTITEPTMRELSALLGHLRTQEATLRAELATLTDRISVIERALHVVHDLSNPDAPLTTLDVTQIALPNAPIVQEVRGEPTTSTGSWVKRLHGVKQIDALRLIARENGGTIRTADAKRIFLEAGLAKGAPKHVAPHIYHMLQAADDFERTAPGTFRMVSATSPGSFQAVTTLAPLSDDHDFSIDTDGLAAQEQ